MALDLPQNRVGIRKIQTQKRNVPLEQIIAVEGQSPIATGIDQVGQVLGHALQRRAELQRQGQQLAFAGKYLGQDISPDLANSGLNLDSILKLHEAKIAADKLNKPAKKKPLGEPFKGADGKTYQYFYDENNETTTPVELSQGLPPPKAHEPESHVIVGVDPQGNPLSFGVKSEKITPIPLPGGGSPLPKNRPGAVLTDVKDIDNQLQQLNDLRGMLKDIPGGIAGGAESLLSKATFGAIGGKAKQYNDIRPSIATKIYRAMTGDTRLSDADAASRAYPLLPSLAEPTNVREAKIVNLEKNLTERKKILSSGAGYKPLPGQLQPLTPPGTPTNETPEQRKARLIKEAQGF